MQPPQLVHAPSAPLLQTSSSGRETLFEEMKRYVRFGADDAARLAALRPHAEPHFARIAAEFYDRIREHEQAHDVFTGEAQVERLRRSLIRWLGRVLTGPYDEAYFSETAKIGHAHVRVGLPQRYMFTAMALIRVALGTIADDALGSHEAGPTRSSIAKILDLELAIMLETYRDDLLERAQRIERLERQEVSRTLARTEHRYVSAVELARVMVIGLDAAGVIKLFNTEAERVTGRARDEMADTSFLELLADELRHEHGPLVLSAARGDAQAPDMLETAVRTKSGKLREVRWQLARARAEADDEVVVFAIGQDITDSNALSARVRQTEKLAAVGTLAAGLAHEIRNPLNGAQLHVTFLERGMARLGITDPDSLEAVRIVREEIRRLSTLVSEFLDFARPKPLTLTTGSVRALCERAVQLARPDAERAEVQLDADLPSSDVAIQVDSARIEQVLLNLLRNAVEALAPQGGGRVMLRARREPRFALIEVEDEGPGLTSPEAPIFDPFYSTKPHGTGLGLAIVHRIVTDHGGSIDFTSKPGRTVFRVRLPIQLGA